MMRGLSLWNPWALFVARHLKLNETRSWATPYRGEIAIHASKTTQELYGTRLLLSSAGVIASLDEPDDFPKEDEEWPLGKVVAVATLTDCVPTHTVRAALSRMEAALGNYDDGRFAWLLAGVRALREPLPCRGRQGLWVLDAETEARVRGAA